MQWLSAKPRLLFDGIAGDILGDPVGWSVLPGIPVENRSLEDELEEIAAHAVTNVLDSLLNSEQWPSVSDLREALKAHENLSSAEQHRRSRVPGAPAKGGATGSVLDTDAYPVIALGGFVAPRSLSNCPGSLGKG